MAILLLILYLCFPNVYGINGNIDNLEINYQEKNIKIHSKIYSLEQQNCCSKIYKSKIGETARVIADSVIVFEDEGILNFKRPQKALLQIQNKFILYNDYVIYYSFSKKHDVAVQATIDKKIIIARPLNDSICEAITFNGVYGEYNLYNRTFKRKQ